MENLINPSSPKERIQALENFIQQLKTNLLLITEERQILLIKHKIADAMILQLEIKRKVNFYV